MPSPPSVSLDRMSRGFLIHKPAAKMLALWARCGYDPAMDLDCEDEESCLLGGVPQEVAFRCEEVRLEAELLGPSRLSQACGKRVRFQTDLKEAHVVIADAVNFVAGFFFDDIHVKEVKERIDEQYDTDLANSSTRSVSTLSNIVIDESESDSDGSSSSSNSSVEYQIVETEPTLSTLKQK
ncbi:hypothetical protein SASPL_126790 [Salvia splendens]|uniref:Uncharacterized protein n=1 Tax=Salvia splendens TaxID=180675 RepID=A0A8X8ZRB5_SALSN|nr:hypothetical protein SASPL_126790 [Salvia splendens]